MFLSKNKNGFWYVYYDNNKGNRKAKSTGTKNKNEAIKFFNHYRKKVEAEFYQDVIPITFKKFTFDYLRRQEPFLTYKTLKIYQSSFKMFERAKGDLQLEEITTRMIEDYLLQRAMQVSIFAARRDLIIFSASFNKAVKDGYLLKNPCTGIKRFKLPQVQPTFYSRDDFDKLMITIGDNEEMKDIVIFAVNTGLRQMEIITLTWAQFDPLQKMVTLTNQVHITKTKRIRSIPLNPDALEIVLKRYSQRSEEIENIFTLDKVVINPNILTQRFKKYVIKAKINPKLHFHSLRHTFASWLVQSGVSIYVVSKLLGHSSISTTEIYSHLRSDDFKDAVDKITKVRIIPKAAAFEK